MYGCLFIGKNILVERKIEKNGNFLFFQILFRIGYNLCIRNRKQMNV